MMIGKNDNKKTEQKLRSVKNTLVKIPDQIWKRYFSGIEFFPSNFTLEKKKDYKYNIVKSSEELGIDDKDIWKLHGKQSLLEGVTHEQENCPFLEEEEIKAAIQTGHIQQIEKQIYSLQNKKTNAEIMPNNNKLFNLHFNYNKYIIVNDDKKCKLSNKNSILFFDKTKKEVSLYNINNEKKKEGIVSIYTLKNGIIQNTKNFFYKNGIMKNVKVELQFENDGTLKNNYDIICKDGTKIHMHEDKIKSVNDKTYDALPIAEKLPLEKLILSHNKKQYKNEIPYTEIVRKKLLNETLMMKVSKKFYPNKKHKKAITNYNRQKNGVLSLKNKLKNSKNNPSQSK